MYMEKAEFSISIREVAISNLFKINIKHQEEGESLVCFEELSKYIENILLGIDVFPIFLDGRTKNEKGEIEYVLLNYKNRINSVLNYILSKYNLCGLEILKDLENKSFNDLSLPLRNRILCHRFLFYIIEYTKSEEVFDKLTGQLFIR